MPVAASSLISVDQLKAYLGPAVGNQNDALFELLIDSVSEAFNGNVGRTLAKTTHTNLYLDGTGEETIELPNWPVISISSVYGDGILLTEGLDADYVLYTSEGAAYLRRIGAKWLPGPKTIKITFVAGYVVQGATPGTGETALPADLRLACSIQVAREWKKTQGSEWGESSRTFPDGSTSRIERGLLRDVEEILKRYRRFGL